VEIPVSAATAISHENQLNEVVSGEAILTSSGESKPPIENQHCPTCHPKQQRRITYSKSKSNTGRHKTDQNSHGQSPNQKSGRKSTACTPHLHLKTGQDNIITSLLQMPTKLKERRNFIYKQNLWQNYWGGGKRKAPLLHNHAQRSLPRRKIAKAEKGVMWP
jgi:hypothetical protein